MHLVAQVCGLSCALVCLAAPVRAQAPLPELMTDTPEYCAHLHWRLNDLVAHAPSPPPREVIELSDSGQRLCLHGHVRGGVQRLRRALIIMMQRAEAP